jgi:hypothetical protein
MEVEKPAVPVDDEKPLDEAGLFKKMPDKNTQFIFGIAVLAIIILITWGIFYYFYATALTSQCKAMQVSAPNSVIASINPNTTTGRLKDYHILTAYNCCSIGNTSNAFVSTCALNSVLQQGARCLDMELYSDQNGLPIVATRSYSNTNIHTKETFNSVPFSSVMSMIVQTAFSSTSVPNSKDPVILHLRFASQNTQMYQNLANTFQQYDSLFLGSEYSYDNNGRNFGDTPVVNLMNKIVVVADQTNLTMWKEVPQLMEYVNMVSGGIHMRCLSYYNVLNTPDLPELQLYNCMCMTLVMPYQGANPSGPICREAGCHFVAMQFQFKTDSNMQECMSFFNQNGCAFAMKTNCPEMDITIADASAQNALVSYQTREVSGNSYSFQI